MAVGPLDNETVKLLPGNLTMSQPSDMSIFRMTDWDLFQKEIRPGRKGISMNIVLKRKITSEMMTTYFPSLLLTAITFATTFFKPFFFEAALSVNLTTMLVMTTIFISKMEGLPPTSDIKMIDIWLILCQMVPFAEVVLLTAMEYFREDDSPEEHNNLIIEIINSDNDEPKEKRCIKLRTPLLKTIGDIEHNFVSADDCITYLLLTNKKFL